MMVTSNWRAPFIRYLTDRSLPEDKVEGERVKRRALRYQLVNGELYRRSASDP